MCKACGCQTKPDERPSDQGEQKRAKDAAPKKPAPK